MKYCTWHGYFRNIAALTYIFKRFLANVTNGGFGFTFYAKLAIYLVKNLWVLHIKRNRAEEEIKFIGYIKKRNISCSISSL